MPDSPVGSRDRTFLIAQNDNIATFNAGPLEFDWLLEQLEHDPAITVQQTLKPRSLTLQQAGPSIIRSVVVATMPEERAAELERHPQIVLEQDHLINPVPATAALDQEPSGASPTLLSPFGTSSEWLIRLLSPEGNPVPGATVYLYGQGVPAQGRTDGAGIVTLSLLNERDDTLRALYVNPQRDYWSLWIDRPSLSSGATNTVSLRSLAQSIPNFPSTQHLGWGQAAMDLDDVPADMDGRNIRVAVIDSGAASLTHPDLTAIRSGVDLTTVPANTVDWTDDTIAHGSHCSGIISGANTQTGVRGFAPAAQVHEARIFPGGRVSSLLDAIDYCMEQQIDVVNMSLGTGGTSQVLLQKLTQAKEQGVACIVAAGNSGNAVQFPGSSPDVLTVAAIGQDGHFPADSYHARQQWTEGTTDQGFFAAQFSCHGPEIDVCAPGVAIVSSVPTNGFAAWDGTSMATPHIAGLAALVLAHHPDFQTPALRLRTSARVDRLFQILKESATPLNLGDPHRTGVGLPNAAVALQIRAGGSAQPGQLQPAIDHQQAAVEAALALVRMELLAAGLLTVELSPVSAHPPAAVGKMDQLNPRLRLRRIHETRQRLADVKAQMRAAGLEA